MFLQNVQKRVFSNNSFFEKVFLQNVQKRALSNNSLFKCSCRKWLDNAPLHGPGNSATDPGITKIDLNYDKSEEKSFQ